jgi:hypothetical protein
VHRNQVERFHLNCAERNELEKIISACLRSLTGNSKKAVGMASAPPKNASAKFRALEIEHAEQKARLEALRECLRIHRDWHGC